MKLEDKKQLEDAAVAARTAADAAHQAAADAGGADDGLNEAADTAEDAAIAAQTAVDGAVVDDTTPPGEDEDDDKDIDFDAEAKALEEQRPPVPAPANSTELEKATRSLHFNAKRVRELGGDPTKVIAPPANNEERAPAPLDTSNFVTKDDKALEEARKLGRTDSEIAVIMHRYNNSIKKSGDPVKDIENAYMIAHKGRIQRSFAEIRRGSFARPTPGTPPGRRPRAEDARTPELSSSDQQVLINRGFVKQADGSWESKRYRMFYSTERKGFIEEKKRK